jgi:hypothetical protein
MARFVAQTVAIGPEPALRSFEPPEGCDSYPIEVLPWGASLLLVWRVTPPPIPTAPPKAKKAKP